MSKYTKLHNYLAALDADEITMGFDDIIELIERPLPISAYNYNAWWANNPDQKSQVKAWRSAGFIACNLDRGNALVTFRRVR